MWHELESAYRMRHAFEIVALSVCEVIHRISMPFRSCAVVRCLYDSIHDRVAEVHVRVCHVELCAQHHRTLHSLRSVHLVEKFQAFLHRSVSVRRLHSSLCRRAFLLGNLLACLFVYVCLSVFNHPYGEVPEFLEIVRGVIYVSPFESEPLYVVQDRVHVFRVLFAWVSIVEAQVAHSVVFLCHTEVHADGFGVSYVQISVRLWWETCLYSFGVLSFFEVFLDQLFHEAEALFLLALYFF